MFNCKVPIKSNDSVASAHASIHKFPDRRHRTLTLRSAPNVIGDSLECGALDRREVVGGPAATRNKLLSVESLCHLDQVQEIFYVGLVSYTLIEGGVEMVEQSMDSFLRSSVLTP